MLYRLGFGKVTEVDGTLEYNGTFPICEDGDELMIMRRGDLEALLKHDIIALLTTHKAMVPELYEVEDDDNPPFFENELEYMADDGTLHKLFLDRSFYSPNYKDMVFVRYVSVDQSIIEEGTL